MRQLLIVFTSLFIAVACSTTHQIRPPGEAKIDEKPVDRIAALQTLPPTIQGCVTSMPDYVVTGSETTVSGDEHCFPSNGIGGFGPRMDIPGLSRVDGMDVADMDGDGDNDFLACDGSIGVTYLYTQGPANVFVPTVAASNITSGVDGSVYCTNLRIADFNEDGLNDFVVGDNRVAKGMFIYQQGPVGTFNQVAPGLDVSWASPTGANCNCLFGVAAGDVDDDGHQDVLLLGYRGAGAGHLYFYKGDGTGGMAAPVLKFDISADFPVVQTPTGLALFDLESDGDLDVVIGGSSDGSHYVYQNMGAGSLATPGGSSFDVNNYTGIDAYDVNSDGFDDVVLVDWSTRRLVYLENIAGALSAPSAVNSVMGASIGIGAPELVTTPTLALDHFQCYRTDDKPVDRQVILTDQFGKSEAHVLEPVRFCNPVQKVHNDKLNPIRHRHHHLKFYRIDSKEPDVTRGVYVDNQFGKKQKLMLTRPLFLAVPTQKLFPGEHPPPKGLDHFKCYQAEGEPIQALVDLKDQFRKESQVKVYKPFVLCNPAEKQSETHENKIHNRDAHLMCYHVEERPYEGKVKAKNQFGLEELAINESDMLCVPSMKKTQIFGDPLITRIGHIPLLNINGGNVLAGGPGTGLAGVFGFDRPFGRRIAIHGDITASVHEYRVVYRPAGDPRPAPASAAVGIAVIPAVGWLSEDWTGGGCSLLPATPVSSSADGWFNAAEYRRMAEGEGVPFNHICSPNLALTVWNSQTAIPDTEGHYVVWLQWRNAPMGPIFEEPFDHHVQLDNKPPENLSLNIPGGACATYGAADMPIMVQGHIDDAHFWRYHIRVFGGNPPDAHSYGWVNYNAAVPEAANVGPTGTIGVGDVNLREVNVNDMVPPPLVKCAYGVRIRAEDRTIHGGFNAPNNLLPWGLGLESAKEITFDYTP